MPTAMQKNQRRIQPTNPVAALSLVKQAKANAACCASMRSARQYASRAVTRSAMNVWRSTYRTRSTLGPIAVRYAVVR